MSRLFRMKIRKITILDKFLLLFFRKRFYYDEDYYVVYKMIFGRTFIIKEGRINK